MNIATYFSLILLLSAPAIIGMQNPATPAAAASSSPPRGKPRLATPKVKAGAVYHDAMEDDEDYLEESKRIAERVKFVADFNKDAQERYDQITRKEDLKAPLNQLVSLIKQFEAFQNDPQLNIPANKQTSDLMLINMQVLFDKALVNYGLQPRNAQK